MNHHAHRFQRVEQWQDGLPLRVVVPSQAHLHRESDVACGGQCAHQFTHPLGMCQHARPLAVQRDGRERTSQVQVDVAVTHAGEFAHHHQGLGGFAGQNLRHHGHIAVCLRSRVGQVAPAHRAALHTDERCGVIIHPAHHGMMRPAPQVSGESLQWRCRYNESFHGSNGIFHRKNSEFLPKKS